MGSRKAFRHTVLGVAALGAAALVAVALSAFLVRTPESWEFIPSWFFEYSEQLLKPTTQEQQANAEFFGIWLATFFLNCVVAAFVLAAHEVNSKGRLRAV